MDKLPYLRSSCLGFVEYLSILCLFFVEALSGLCTIKVRQKIRQFLEKYKINIEILLKSMYRSGAL